MDSRQCVVNATRLATVVGIDWILDRALITLDDGRQFLAESVQISLGESLPPGVTILPDGSLSIPVSFEWETS